MTSSVPAALPDDHRLHDRLLVVRGAIEKLDASDQPAASALLERCGDCRELADDVRALRAELAVLPAPARARDFRLSTADAERLRGGLLQRLLRPLASPSFTILQPLAGVAVALGLGLLVLTSIPAAGLGFGGQGAPADNGVSGLAAPAAGSPAPTAGMVGGAPLTSRQPGNQPYGETGGTRSTTGEAEGGAGSATDKVTGIDAQRDAVTTPDWRLIGLALLITGVALLVLRRIAARQVADPLLR